jgi:hypothetical protein
MTKIVLPKPPKYEIEVGALRRIVDFGDGYLYLDPKLNGHYVVTMYKSRGDGGQVRIIAQWDDKKTAHRHAKALRKAVPKFLDQEWERRGDPIKLFKVKP